MPTLAEMLAKQRAEKEAKTNEPVGKIGGGTQTASPSPQASNKTNSGNSILSGIKKPATDLGSTRGGNIGGDDPKATGNGSSAPTGQSAVQSAKPSNAGNNILARFQKPGGKPNGGIEAETSGQSGKVAGQSEGKAPAVSQQNPPQTVTVEPKKVDPIPQPVDIPEEQKIAVGELQKQLAYMKDNIDDKDLLKPVIQNILIKLQTNPELGIFVPPDDVNHIVAALRKAYKYEARKSEERKTKRTTKEAKVSKLAQEFADLGFGNIGGK